jgi:hypothetical protein
MIRRVLPLVLLLVLAGPLHAQRAAAPAHDRDRISPEEVQRSTATDAYQLVQSLRSFWFTRREARLATRLPATPKRDAEGLVDGMNSHTPEAGTPEEAEGPDGLIVILDRTLLGGPEALREIPINRVLSVEFLSSAQASSRYGRRSRDGAIVVHTLGSDR